MLKKSKILVCMVIVTAISVASCGFHLRGAYELNDKLKILSITPDDYFDPFHKKLRSVLQKTHVKLVARELKQGYLLNIESPTYSESIIAYSTLGQAERIRITILVSYSLTDQNQKHIPTPAVINKYQDFTLNSSSLLSSDQERETIKNELAQSAANELLRQLSKIEPSVL